MARRKIGKIVNYYGLKGQIKVNITTTSPEKRFAIGKKIIVSNKLNQDETFIISSVMVKNPKIYYIGLEGFKDINEIQWMIGRDIFADVRVAKGTYFYDELIGMTVIDASGNEVGAVENFTVMPAGEYLIVGKHYIPFQLDRFVAKVDKPGKKIHLTQLGTETLI